MFKLIIAAHCQFHSEIGVWQGCFLPPTFNIIFINDFETNTAEVNSEVSLDRLSFSYGIFVDDLLLLSEDRDGL